MKGLLRTLGRTLLIAIALGCTAWAALALHFSLPNRYADGAAIIYVLSAIGVLFLRPSRRGLLLNFLGFAAVLCGWLFLVTPSAERDWAPEYSRMPGVHRDGDRITITGIRNFNYRSETDFDVAYYDKTFDLREIRGIDMFISSWGSPHIAHTILSFGFADGSHLAVSVETRREKGEQYSPLGGFFRQFELVYVVADERDVIRLRTNYRKEQVSLFHLAPPPEKVRAVFLDYVKRIEELSRAPEFYNALLQNCTTSIYFSFQVAPPFPPLSLGILLPGYLDHFIWSVGTKRRLLDIPFQEYKRRSFINDRAQAADADPLFSEAIRRGLPEPDFKREALTAAKDVLE